MSQGPSALRRAWPLLLARVVVAGWGISLPMVLARTLLPADYGTFKQAWLLSSTLFLLLPFGVSQSLLYFLPHDGRSSRVYVSHALLFTWGVGLVSGLALWLLGPAIGTGFHNATLTRLMPWVALVTAMRLCGQAWDVAVLGNGDVRGAAGIRAAYETFYTVCVVGAALLTRTLDGIVFGIALATTVRAAAGTFDLVRRFGFGLDRRLLATQLRYALPFGLACALLIPQQQFHLYAVSAAVPAAAFALYSVGCLQLPVVEMLYTPISDVMMLAIAEEDAKGRRHLAGDFFRDAVSRLSFVFIPLLALLLVVAPVMIRFFFTDRYVEAVPLFRITLLSIPLAALPLDGVMRARAQNRFLLAVSVAKLAASVVLVLLGLRLFGLVGALIGFMISEEVGRVLLLVRAMRVLEGGLARLLPLRDLALRALAAAVAAAAASVAVRIPSALILQGIAAGAVFTVVYLAVLRALGGLPPIRTWLPRRSPLEERELRVAA